MKSPITITNNICNKKQVLSFFLIILASLFSIAQQLSFPSAKGAGAYATGGRGGQVIHVTTLDWDAPGGFKEAIQTPGPRIIVFDVSGEIDASGEGDYYNIINGSAYDNITIAGQTAPSGGITVITSSFRFANVDNVILRYIRFRNAPGQGTTDALWFWGGSNMVLDHCTFSHGADESADIGDSVGQMGDITIQNCFFQDSKTGLIVGVDNSIGDYTVVSNVFSNISHRFPNVKGDGRYDLINNIVYNWKWRLVNASGGGSTNVVNNYYKPSLGGLIDPNGSWFNNSPISSNYMNKLEARDGVDIRIYTSGSIITGQREVPQVDDSDMWTYFVASSAGYPADTQVDSSFFADIMFPLVGESYAIKTAQEAYIEVLNDVGANKTLNANGSISLYQDTKDAADILMIQNDTYDGSWYNWSEASYPIVPENTRPNDFYNSNQHIPEVWFLANVPNGEGHNDIAPSGYTWLEEYLNQVDANTGAAAIGVEGIEVLPSTAEIQVPETITLTVTFTPSNATNQNGIWSSSDEAIATVDQNGNVTAVADGIVTITFTSNDGGYADTSEITVFPEALQASAGDDQQICEGETATLTATGGTNYIWSNGETSAVIEVTPSETTIYTVTVSDDNGQSDEASVTVSVNTIPVASAGEDQTICEGESITLTATGGTSYLWSTGETTESIEVNPVIETIYSVEVNSNNCSSTDDITVFVNNAPNITITEDLVIVEGESTTLTVSGGENYLWSTSETSESIIVSPMTTTTYTVSSTGVNGCLSSVEVTVTVIPEVIANAGEDVTICNGDTVTLSASGGVTYIWNTGETGADLIVNPEITTTYTVTVEDDYGYTDTDSVTIFVNDTPVITTDENVYVMIGNAVTLTAAAGNTYNWSTGETASSISVSPAVTTTYTVTGISENGCQSTVEILVTVVEELNANAGDDVSICIGDSVTLNASGGITYTWNTGDTGASPTFTPIETTIYTVTVTDGFGNSDSDDVTITINQVPVAYAGEDQTVCEGESVTLTAEGGDSYLWSTGETSATIIVSTNSETTYTVEVFSNNCSDSDDVTIFTLEGPDVSVSDDRMIMTGSTTTLVATGANSYSWNTGDTSDSIIVSPTETTTYTVTGFSVNGCQSTAQVTVTVVPELIANAGNDVTICNGESVTLNASGGASYTWNTGDTGASPTFSPTTTTTYTVTVTDGFGNSDTDSVTVIVNELPDVTVSENITIIEGESTNLVVNGAETYLWNTGEISSSITVSPLQTTTYTVTGTTNSCSVQAQVTVTVEELFVASAGSDESVCDNDSYEIVLTANQGDSYLWSTGETTQSITVSPLSTTTYTVVVTHGTQEDSDDVTVYVEPSPIVEISNGDNVEILSGDYITLSASGANTYQWNNGATQANIAVSPSATTTYQVTGFIGDCYDEKQVAVNVLQPVVADAGEDVLICLDDVATLTATGGDEYVWNTGETTQTIQVSPTETTDYTVTVFNALDFDEASVRVEVDINCEIETIVPPIEELLDFNFDIYPNPARNVVNVKLSGTSIDSDVIIYDFTGKLVQRTKISNENLSPVTTTQIDISMLQSGVYFVKLIDKDRDITKKLIVR